jgi:hypothetical protein
METIGNKTAVLFPIVSIACFLKAKGLLRGVLWNLELLKAFAAAIFYV